MTRLVVAVGIQLLVGLVWSLRGELPELYPARTVPAPDGELWTLNPE